MPASSPRPLRTFVRLLGFLRPYRWSLAASVVLAVGSQGAGMAIPALTGLIIDDAIANRDERELVFLVSLVAVAGLARGLFLMGRRFIAGRQALGVEFDMRNALYTHLLRLSWGFYDRHQTGQLMSRATVDLQGVRFFLGYGLIFFGQHILTIVAVTAILFVYDWELALIALAITPVLVAVAYLYSRASHPILKDVQQRLGDMTTVAEESIVGVNVVKAFAQARRAAASGERIFEILDEPEEVADSPDAAPLPPGDGRLRFEDVTFGYDAERPVLRGIDLEIEPGTTVALIGHTGSGKTTLTALVPRFYDVQRGRVLLDDADVRDVRLADLRRAIGIVSQDPFLFSATVRENIA